MGCHGIQRLSWWNDYSFFDHSASPRVYDRHLILGVPWNRSHSFGHLPASEDLGSVLRDLKNGTIADLAAVVFHGKGRQMPIVLLSMSMVFA